MKDILKFGYVELKELNKTLVYIKEFKLNKTYESWRYNNINFQVNRLPNRLDRLGKLSVGRSSKGRINSFLLYIGVEENYYVVDNDVVKLFKDLEFFVYNKMSLKEYLNNNDVYYFITYSPRHNEFLVDKFNLRYDSNDLSLFLSGNIFKDLESGKKFVNKVNKNKLNIFEELKKRANNELKNIIFYQ